MYLSVESRQNGHGRSFSPGWRGSRTTGLASPRTRAARPCHRSSHEDTEAAGSAPAASASSAIFLSAMAVFLSLPPRGRTVWPSCVRNVCSRLRTSWRNSNTMFAAAEFHGGADRGLADDHDEGSLTRQLIKISSRPYDRTADVTAAVKRSWQLASKISPIYLYYNCVCAGMYRVSCAGLRITARA